MVKKKLNKLENAALVGLKNETKQLQGDGRMHLTWNQMQHVAFNALLRRRDLIRSLLDQGHDIDHECGYPDSISIENYRDMYARNGIAARVVNIWPDECFSEQVEAYETEKEDEKTEFEKGWYDVVERFNLIHYVNRVDVLSGIGSFGLLLFGIGDGKPLKEPVAGIDPKTGAATQALKYPLLYIRAFSECDVTISKKVTDDTHPRNGYPEMYQVNFEEIGSLGVTSKRTVDVHWTRVVHVADNRESSEVYGVPRMQRVWNDLLNIRKTLGGSAEMFWRGGFPGIAFEMNKGDGMTEVTDDTKKTMTDNIEDYFAGLDRALFLENVSAKPMAPQVADPKSHFDTQIQSICITLGIPHRMFMGSEEAKMASTQDQKAWDRRVMKRQQNYLTPMLIRPVIDRLITYGILPTPANGYKVWWKDRAALTESEIAEVALKETDAMSKYVSGNVQLIMAPKDWFTSTLKKTAEEAMVFEDNVRESEPDLEIEIPAEEPVPVETPEKAVKGGEG